MDVIWVGLPRRVVAFLVDYLVLGVYVGVMSGVFAALPSTLTSRLFATPSSGQVTVIAILTVPVLAYFAICEGTGSGATIGKRVLRLRVVRADDPSRHPSLLRSVGRSSLKLVPWELAHTALWRVEGWPSSPETPSGAPLAMLIGVWALVLGSVVSVLVTRRHRSLYDLASGTGVRRVEGTLRASVRGASP